MLDKLGMVFPQSCDRGPLSGTEALDNSDCCDSG